jgi:hypothetical protein
MMAFSNSLERSGELASYSLVLLEHVDRNMWTRISLSPGDRARDAFADFSPEKAGGGSIP